MTLRMSSKVRGFLASRRSATRSSRRSSGCIGPMIMPLVIRLRRGVVVEILDERRGAIEVSVRLDGERMPSAPSRAIAYPDLVGPVGPGDRVLLNTTAVSLGLGTGGLHFVVALEGSADTEAPGPGRTMKLRYTPQQVRVPAVAEEGGPHRTEMEEATDLGGLPVVWVPL